MQITPLAVGGILLGIATAIVEEQPVTIRTDVNLVQLDARVTDSQGHSVTGLTKDAFQLFIDNAPKEITIFQGEDAPVTAGIVIDNSASMGPKKNEVIAAALAFARASNPKDQMFVVHFNNVSRFGLPEATPFTGDISQLEKAIAAFQLGGTTAFYDAVALAESHLGRAWYQRRILLTITDGGDNSSRATLSEVTERASQAGIAIYPIGIFDENDRDRNPPALSQIASQTGGEAFFPREIAEITNICVGIAMDVRRQYTLGFPGAEDGRYHSIRLTAKDPRDGALKVYTRTGYIANQPSKPGANRMK